MEPFTRSVTIEVDRAACMNALLARCLDRPAQDGVPITYPIAIMAGFFAEELQSAFAWESGLVAVQESLLSETLVGLVTGEAYTATAGMERLANAAHAHLWLASTAAEAARLEARVSLVPVARLSPAPPRRRDMGPAETIRSKPLTADIVQAHADLVGDRNPIHVDEGFARRIGLPGCVVHGTLIAAILSETAVALGFPRQCRLSVRFLAPVAVGEAVTVKATTPGEAASATHRMRLTALREDGLAACVAEVSRPAAGPLDLRP